jgi:uncharacterized membrane protein YidH (DUF202 family)
MSQPIGQPARPWDSGLQSERTKLAWQRTALSTLAFSLVVTRLIAFHSWPLAAVVAGLAGIAALAVAVSSTGRYRRINRALHGSTALPDARSFVALCALAVVAGIGALAYLITSRS